MSIKFFIACPPYVGYTNSAVNPEKVVCVSWDNGDDMVSYRIVFQIDRPNTFVYWKFRDYESLFKVYNSLIYDLSNVQ